MKLTTAFLSAAIIVMSSCSDAKKDSNNELDALNAKSKECIKIMNTAEAQQTAAINAGNSELVSAYQKTIDSAARENVKIGQEIMALQDK